MHGVGRHGTSSVRWMLGDTTAFTVSFLIIAAIIILDPLGGSADANLCESNDSSLRCNTGQLRATTDTLDFTVTNKADSSIILESVTMTSVNDIPVNKACHDKDKLIRSQTTYPLRCDETTLSQDTINKVILSYNYYRTGGTQRNSVEGELLVYVEPRL